jgi:hypothetical protein
MTLIDRLSRLLLPAPDDDAIADYPFVASDVALYQRTLHSDGGFIDAQTWDDMLLPQYSARLARETSIFGQQELHRRLRVGDGGGDAAVRVRTLAADAGQRSRLQTACAGLRRSDREISASLFGPAIPVIPRWTTLLPWMPVAFLSSVVLALVTGFMPLWMVALGFWLVLTLVQVRFHEAAEEWRRTLATLQHMLRAHTLLEATATPLTADFAEDAARAGKINRSLARSPLSGMAGLREYGDWLWLLNIRHYFNSREMVRTHAGFLRASFERVAALEADLALARHLADTPHHCWAERGDSVVLTRVTHPLLDGAAPLSIALRDRGIFISGQNGIGKSTLLRTVGLNLIVARAFGFCYADAAMTALLPVHSSMQGEDTLEGGESLYIAELRRAQELLALAARGPAVFIIDEIFRGTNHLESISAATAVLHTLAERGKVIVSSHNLVLAPLLEDRLAPWCVGRVDGRLQLVPGVLRETNGIALLEARGFDDAISAKANRVFDWLSDYMAHPADCEDVRNSL